MRMIVRAFPSSSVIDGKYRPGPNIWVQVGTRAARELSLGEAKELRRQLSYLIKLCSPKP